MNVFFHQHVKFVDCHIWIQMEINMIKHHFRTGMLGKQARENKLLIWGEIGWSKVLLAAKIVLVLILGGETFNCTLIPTIMNGFILAPVIYGTLVITEVSVWYTIFISSVPFLTSSCVLKRYFVLQCHRYHWQIFICEWTKIGAKLIFRILYFFYLQLS